MKRRQQWGIIARREMVVKLTDHTFIIGTIITLSILIAAIGFLVYRSSNPSTVTVAVTDAQSKAIVEAVNAGKKDPWKIKEVDTQETASTGVDNGDYDFALVKKTDRWEILVKEIKTNTINHQIDVDKAASVASVTENAAAHGIDPNVLLNQNPVEVKTLSDQDSKSSFFALMVGIAFAVIFFSAALMFGFQIAASVVKEKESRVVEILSATVAPSQLLLGKIVGNSVLALGQVILYLTVAGIGISFTEYAFMLPPILVSGGWFLALFIAGFLALSCLWAASGAMATQYEDIQHTSLPLNIILMAGYGVALFAPTGVNAVLSYVPIFSSVLMPMRLAAESAKWWEAALALAANLAFMVVAIWAGGKLYRRGLLHTGGLIKWRQAFAK